MTNRGTGSPLPGSGIGQVVQVVKDGLWDGVQVIMRVTPLHLIDHADRLTIRQGSRVEWCYDSRSGYRGADAFDQFEPQVRRITKAEVHLHGISM
jgi:hypothetical protein